MKVFWTIVLLLILAAAGVYVAQQRTAAPPSLPPSQQATDAADALARAATSPSSRPPSDPPASARSEVDAGASPEATTPPRTDAASERTAEPDDASRTAATPTPAKDSQEPTATAKQRDADPTPQPPAEINMLIGSGTLEEPDLPFGGGKSVATSAPNSSELNAAPTGQSDAPTASSAGTAAPGAAPSAAAAGTASPAAASAEPATIPAKIETQGDGSLKIDDRFVVTGDGTIDKPYQVTWDHLISVQELYNPRDGKKRLPERVTMLDGKYVTISGYVAFPLYVEKPKELLSMLNQWDGCCIGVPPTPFDAIEVRLKTPVEGTDRYATQGAITGKFGVKPYLAGDWLVGLYVMDSASMSTKSTANTGGFNRHGSP